MGRAQCWGASASLLALLCGCSLFAAQGGDKKTAVDEMRPAATALPLATPLPGAASGRASLPPGPPATRIERVTIEPSAESTLVVLDLDGSAEPEVSLLVNQRLVIDVPGTSCPALPRVIEAKGDPLIERIRTGQHAAPAVKSRVVIDLKVPVDFAVRAQPGRIVVRLAPAGIGGAAAGENQEDAANVLLRAEPGRTSGPGAAEPRENAARALEPSEHTVDPPPAAIDAPATAVAATPAVAAEKPSSAEPVATAAAPAATEVTSTPQPAATPDPAATREASPATPEPLIEATQAPTAPTPAETAATDGSIPAPRADDEAAQDPSAVAPAEAEPLATPRTMPAERGKRISIDFADADVRTVLSLIARAGGYQVIFTPEVGGEVSVKLVDRPWEDALDTVLRAKKLQEVRHEDVMLISPLPRGTRPARRPPP